MECDGILAHAFPKNVIPSTEDSNIVLVNTDPPYIRHDVNVNVNVHVPHSLRDDQHVTLSVCSYSRI